MQFFFKKRTLYFIYVVAFKVCNLNPCTFHKKDRCFFNRFTFLLLSFTQYPKYEVEEALMAHYDLVRSVYKDAFVETENSVDDLEDLEEETYLCPSVTAYVKPLRAVNSHGKWKVIVNNVKLYHDTLTQSARSVSL